jgi:hypothetical protein
VYRSPISYSPLILLRWGASRPDLPYVAWSPFVRSIRAVVAPSCSKSFVCCLVQVSIPLVVPAYVAKTGEAAVLGSFSAYSLCGLRL